GSSCCGRPPGGRACETMRCWPCTFRAVRGPCPDQPGKIELREARHYSQFAADLAIHGAGGAMNLLRAAATVSGLTLLSRITGLVRENLIAAIFGASAHTDAFFVAFRLPNLLRRLFAEGAFSQAFVPILADVRERSEREGDPARLQTLVDRVATGLFWTVLLVSILGALAAPGLVWLMASGLARDPDTFQVATNLTRWMFPYILFVSMVALAAGILNTWRRFMVPAFAPVLLNLNFIGAALLLTPWFDPPIYALAAGVVLGGIAQLAIQVPALRRIGVLPRIGLGLRAAFADPDTRRILKLMA